MNLTPDKIKPSKDNLYMYNKYLHKRVKDLGFESVYLYIPFYWSDLELERKIEHRRFMRNYPIKVEHLMIGEMDRARDIRRTPVGFKGKRLEHVLKGVDKDREHFYYSGSEYTLKDWVDVTTFWWVNYENYGMCLYSRAHHSWVDINKSSRRCLKCGTHSRKVLKERLVKERELVWEEHR